MKKILNHQFLMLIILLTFPLSAMGEKNIMLITYGSDSKTVEGDNDYRQEIVIRIPADLKEDLYLRIFDPDVGGKFDDKFGFHRGFDTQTRFSLLGAGEIKSEIFGLDRAADNTWYEFARFSPQAGERAGDHYVFKLRIEGLKGDDGNVFDVAVSERPDENRSPEGTELFSYEPTIRLPASGISAELRFQIPSDGSEVIIRGFDLAWAKLRVDTRFRSGLRAVNPSGQGQWAENRITLEQDENGRLGALRYAGGREIPNDATFTITDQDGNPLAVELPIRISKAADNHRPVPRISVTYLPDCYSVQLDASGSTDRDRDRLTYFWDFGDGQTREGVRVNHRYDTQSEFEVKLTATDDSGAVSNSAYVKETVSLNQPPKAVINASVSMNSNRQPAADSRQPTANSQQLIAAPGQEIVFDGSESEDADGEVKSYYWNFGDSGQGYQSVVSHSFQKPGDYEVSLRVQDDSDSPCNRDTAVINVRVNAQPVVEIGKNRSAAIGEELVFEPEKASDSDGTIIRYVWDMGDGTIKEGEKITHAYQKAGEYSVVLTAEDDSGAINSTGTDTLTVRVNDPPIPVPGEDRESAVGEKISFDGSESSDPDGKLIGYFWDFGDGQEAEGAKVSHTYKDPGVYMVMLTVEDDSGTSSAKQSASLTVTVNDPPEPRFETRTAKYTNDTKIANQISDRGAADDPVTFDASASFDRDGHIIGYFWDFGDETEGEGKTAEHTYKKPGTYTVTLTVEDDSGTSSAKASASMRFIVNYPPVADAGADQRVTASEVRFDGKNASDPDGKIIDYRWDFGDGETGAGESPVHVFRHSGTYSVTLTVTDDSETLSSQDSDEMTLIINSPPIADTGPDQTGMPDQVIRFEGGDSLDPDGTVSEYHWDFGDGTTGTGISPSHTYTASGVYPVRLTVQDDSGASDTDEMLVKINAPPVARITSQFPILNSQFLVAPGQPVTLNAKESYDSDGKITEYRWDFRASSDTESVETLKGETTVDKIYSEPGLYSVFLTVRDDSTAANDRSRDEVFIRVNHPPIANPGKDIVTCDRGIRFDASKSADPDGEPLSYLWDFGDGSPRKAGVKVTHTYKESGTYPVILMVDDNTGLENSKNSAAITVTLNEPPMADAGDDQTVCAGDVVLFSAARSRDPEGGLLRFHWDFGDGTDSDSLNPTKIFKKSGSYQVTLTAEDDSGLPCSRSSDQMVVRVTGAPIADAGTDMSVCANTEVQFDGSKSYDIDGLVNRFFWDFGDGQTGGGDRPLHIYQEPGIYLVRLTITGDSAGLCDTEDTAEITVTVRQSPEASLDIPRVVALKTPAKFDGSGSKGNGSEIVSWNWDFGDGTSGTDPIAEHTYQKIGRYEVRLTVETNSKTGCNVIAAQKIVVVNAQPVADPGKDIFTGVNDVIVLNGSGSYDPDGSVVRYEWDFGDGQTGTGVEVRHQYAAGGRYQVRLTVTDDTDVENNRAEDTLWVTVNHAPEPVISVKACPPDTDDCRVCAGENIGFSAGNSADPDGNLLKNNKSRYYWDFGDGHTAEAVTVSHTYKTPGKYQAALIVDDGAGAGNSRSEAYKQIIVNHPPVADSRTDSIACPGETVSFDASGSADPDGEALLYQWDFGDGEAAEGKTASHIFDQAGSYKVRLTVDDGSGTACAQDKNERIVKINAAPLADAGPDREAFAGGANDAVLFDATQSRDPDGDPLTCYWDFGDGIQEIGSRVFHTYAQPGIYTVRLRVSDGRETNCSESTDELTVTVRKRD
jgi:PKD repeat protein